jgi:hypothetical protein
MVNLLFWPCNPAHWFIERPFVPTTIYRLVSYQKTSQNKTEKMGSLTREQIMNFRRTNMAVYWVLHEVLDRKK